MFDIVKWLESKGHQVLIKDGYVQSSCPIHEDSDNPTAFTYWFDRQTWKCWTRGCVDKYGWKLKNLVAAVLKVSPDNEMVQKEIEAYSGSTGSVPGVASPLYNIPKTNVVAEPPRLWWCKELEQFNYDRELCRKYRIGGIKSKNDHIISIAFMVYDRSNEYCGYTKRLLDNFREFILRKTGKVPSKWLHSKGLATRKILYGENHLNLNYNHCVLLEGPRDVCWMWKNNVINPLATFGIGLKQQQEQSLIESGIDTIYIMYDHDEAGLKFYQSDKFKRMCSLFNVKIMTDLLPKSTDVDETTELISQKILQNLPKFSKSIVYN